MGKKPTVSVTYENERISIKNSLPYLKCVLLLSCVVHRPIYGRFMGFKCFYFKRPGHPHSFFLDRGSAAKTLITQYRQLRRLLFS